MPPVWLFNHILAMLAIHRLLPIAVLIAGPLRWLGLVPLAAGLAIVLYSARLFDRIGTTIKPFEESSALLTGGPYRFTRNPMYLGMLLALAGIAILLGTLSPWFALPLFAAIIDWRFIRPEEAMLRERFGAEFDDYARRVRRWI